MCKAQLLYASTITSKGLFFVQEEASAMTNQQLQLLRIILKQTSRDLRCGVTQTTLLEGTSCSACQDIRVNGDTWVRGGIAIGLQGIICGTYNLELVIYLNPISTFMVSIVSQRLY